MKMKLAIALTTLLLGTATFAAEDFGLMSLKLMKKKGVINEAEYESALRDTHDTTGSRDANDTSVVLGKWSTMLYGFVEGDQIFDSTQGLTDAAGNAQIQRPDTYQGKNQQIVFGVRNSRIGFRLRAPEFEMMRASALLEMDFIGNQPAGISEGAYFTNPSFRVRHFNLKLETPYIDVLIGQYWHLFGWQPIYQWNVLQIPGVPGMLYARTPQIRVSKTFRASEMTFEAALGMMRPPQKASSAPEGEAGLRFAYEGWSTVNTIGATGTGLSPLSIALSGDIRRFHAAEFDENPQASNDALGWGVAANIFLPIIPAKLHKRDNALSVAGDYAYGYGTADMYSGLNGGVANPALPIQPGEDKAPTYTPDVDPSLAAYTADGVLHPVNWSSYHIGLQYYVPSVDGRLWLSGNWAHLESNNTNLFGTPDRTRKSLDWFDGNIFVGVTPAIQLGVEYAYTIDRYNDGISASNHRVQLSGFYVF
jgi:hypothetical protein